MPPTRGMDLWGPGVTGKGVSILRHHSSEGLSGDPCESPHLGCGRSLFSLSWLLRLSIDTAGCKAEAPLRYPGFCIKNSTRPSPKCPCLPLRLRLTKDQESPRPNILDQVTLHIYFSLRTASGEGWQDGTSRETKQFPHAHRAWPPTLMPDTKPKVISLTCPLHTQWAVRDLLTACVQLDRN